jgi:hypothetical protein
VRLGGEFGLRTATAARSVRLIRRVWLVGKTFLKNLRYQVFGVELFPPIRRCLGVEARLKQFFIF